MTFTNFYKGILLKKRLAKEKKKKPVKARVNKQGLMGSASREHTVKKGKGSFTRNPKHKKDIE